MLNVTPLISSATQDLAALLKAAGDDLRLSVLQALATDSYGVLELAQAFGMKQSGISHHLKVLATAGLVSTRREGNSIFYRRAPIDPNDALAVAKNAIFTQIDALPQNPSVEQALATIWHERTQTSHQFFIENAHKFKAQQDLIASFDVYGNQVAELLALTQTPNNALALEVGPGEGDFLPILAQRFAQVHAIDTSPSMLGKAQQAVCHLANIKLQHGDTRALATLNNVDCAIINMVLHHTPSPAQVLADVSKTLTEGGVLFITELCSHQQTWARDACGDIWLGFEPDDLQSWAKSSGLQLGQSTYFALRNGFQIQIQQFFKQPLQPDI